MTKAIVVPPQIRSARAFLSWTIQDLSASSEVSVRTIKYIESKDNLSNVKDSTVLKLIQALEQAGIEFIGTPDDGPGIRLRRHNPPPSSPQTSTLPLAPTPDGQE